MTRGPRSERPFPTRPSPHPSRRAAPLLLAFAAMATPVAGYAQRAGAPASASASASPAKDPALLARIEALQAKAGKREHFTVTFEQEFWSALRKKLRESEGLLEFRAPRHFRWEILAPDKELYVNDGKDFWKYAEATRHAQRLPPGSVELDFVDLVLKLASLTRRYDVAAWTASPAKSAGPGADAVPARSDQPPPAAGGMLLLKLTPKQEGGQEAVYLRVDEAKAEVRELRIAYRNGNRTRIVFAPLEDKRPGPSRFAFKPPPGTAVDTLE